MAKGIISRRIEESFEKKRMLFYNIIVKYWACSFQSPKNNFY